MTKLGTVKWYNPTKGYGFIKSDDGRDIFVHASALEEQGMKPIMEGQRISFEVSVQKGKEAATKLMLA